MRLVHLGVLNIYSHTVQFEYKKKTTNYVVKKVAMIFITYLTYKS